MELYQVKSFLEIAKTANLTKAASKLHISPSALSSQIKSLEEELEVALFIRKAQGMALTNEGKALLTNAKKILHSSNKMIQKAQDLKENPSGNLNIGINTDPQFLKISLINQRVSQIMPKIKTSFIESQTFETIPMLFEEKIDTGFLYGSISNLMIYSIHLKTVPVCVAVPCSMAQDLSNTSFEQIVSLPWVWTRHNCPFQDVF